MAIGGIAVGTAIQLGVPAVIELVKIGQGIIDKYNNGELTQVEFDAEWEKMQTLFNKNTEEYLAMRRQHQE